MITVLIILVAVLVVILLWLLFAPLSLEADSRIPFMRIRWAGIGKAAILFDGEWTISWNLFWWKKTVSLYALIEKQTTKKISKPGQPEVGKKKRKAMKPAKAWRMFQRIAGTFRVHEWQWALDTGDHTINAKLYPVNFLPGCRGHLLVNFTGENYIRFRISNQAWRILYALWIKK